MHKLILNFFLCCILGMLFLSTSDISADWLISKRAQVWDNNKNVLRFERVLGGPVRIMFWLAKASDGIFKNKLPLYKVDNGPVRNINHMLDIATDKEKSRWIRWTISKDVNPISKELNEIMNGENITFQYYYPDGFIMEITFNLKGADKAISQIIR